jgi:hypothetical protein
MPTALSFRDTDDLIATLKRTRWRSALKKAHGKQEDLGPLTAVYASVTRSTYRAFRSHGNFTPSGVFRSWASEELFNGALADLRDIRSDRQYRTWARKLAQSLSNRWQEQLRYPLNPLPKALKLVNLLAKGLCVVSPIWPDQFSAIVEHVDVALDKFSLRPLACLEGLRYLRDASMGSVKTLDEYDKIQATIRDLCERASVPPIAYDLLMWDGAHTQKT